jgi:ABC-type dipeptide/oligopeptide/nickel transport system permease subunit
MSWLDSLATRMETARELLAFFLSHKWWWLTPMIVVLLLLLGFIVLAQSSGLAPFIYTLF